MVKAIIGFSATEYQGIEYFLKEDKNNINFNVNAGTSIIPSDN